MHGLQSCCLLFIVLCASHVADLQHKVQCSSNLMQLTSRRRGSAGVKEVRVQAGTGLKCRLIFVFFVYFTIKFYAIILKFINKFR